MTDTALYPGQRGTGKTAEVLKWAAQGAAVGQHVAILTPTAEMHEDIKRLVKNWIWETAPLGKVSVFSERSFIRSRGHAFDHIYIDEANTFDESPAELVDYLHPGVPITMTYTPTPVQKADPVVNFDTYQLRTQETAIYPEAGTGSGVALAYVGLGLGEAGEIQNQIKKVIRDDNGTLTDERRAELKKELGDLLWYVARLADELDTSLGAIAQANLDKLVDRSDRGVLQGSGDDR